MGVKQPSRVWAGVLTLVLGLVSNVALAQTDRAVVAFEGDINAVMESKLATELEVKDRLARDMGARWSAILGCERVRGVIAFPESIEAIQEDISQQKMPIDIYIRFDFKSAEDFAEIKEVLAQRSNVVEKDDYTEMRPKSAEANIYLGFGKRWVVLASDHFDVDEDSLERLTGPLKNWDRDPKADFQVAFDVDAVRSFLEEGQDFLRKQAPPVAMLTGFIEHTDFMSLSVTMEGDVMAVLNSLSGSRDRAEQFREQAAGLIAMGKMSLERQPRQDAISDMFLTMMEEMIPKQDGKKVTIKVARPEGFDERIAEAAKTARAAAGKMQQANNLKQIALSMHNYHSVYRRFPFLPSDSDNEGLSWRVRVLPYLENMELMEMFDLDEPWNTPNNRKLVELQPEYFGENGEALICWVESNVSDFREITDGTSNTIALVLVPKKMNWTEPKDVDSDEVMRIFNALEDGEELLVAYYDGSVHRLSADTDPKTLEAMLTPAGGEVVQR